MDGVELYWYRAAPVRVIDGDTILVEIDLGMRTRAEVSLRVAGIDTPEIFSGTDRARGHAAKEATAVWVAGLPPARWPLLVHTRHDGQSFNRYVADVHAADSGESLVDALRRDGW